MSNHKISNYKMSNHKISNYKMSNDKMSNHKMSNHMNNIRKEQHQSLAYANIDSNENFPSLVNTEINIDTSSNNQNYKHLIDIEKDASNIDYYNNKFNPENKFLKGWTIFNKKTNKIISNNITYNNKYNNYNSSDISVNDIYKIYDKLADNWNAFRDEVNYLYGDRSPYINYKEELNRIIEEENNIYEEIYNYHNTQSSDDDDDYDNDDFYYHK